MQTFNIFVCFFLVLPRKYEHLNYRETIGSHGIMDHFEN